VGRARNVLELCRRQARHGRYGVTTTTAQALSFALGEPAPTPAAPPASFEVAFDVRGTPVPQGTLVRSPTGGLYHGKRPELLNWRLRIATAAEEQMAGLPPVTGPVAVELEFRFARPAAHYLPANQSRPEPVLRPDAPRWHTSKPDADKVTRAALDALSSVVFQDDSQVADLVVRKRYVDVDEGPGVRSSVRAVR